MNIGIKGLKFSIVSYSHLSNIFSAHALIQSFFFLPSTLLRLYVAIASRYGPASLSQNALLAGLAGLDEDGHCLVIQTPQGVGGKALFSFSLSQELTLASRRRAAHVRDWEREEQSYRI